MEGQVEQPSDQDQQPSDQDQQPSDQDQRRLERVADPELPIGQLVEDAAAHAGAMQYFGWLDSTTMTRTAYRRAIARWSRAGIDAVGPGGRRRG